MTSPEPAPHGASIAEYCRDIEAYLCRRNDGHLIRVVGPAFDLVAGWAREGIPLRIVFHGIDRTIERKARKGPQRRPLRVEFCEADVLDAFDEWRRAVGVGTSRAEPADSKPPSLASHLERVVRKLSNARATGVLGPEFDSLIDRVSVELDAARSAVRGLRGEARQAVVDRLAGLDAELLSLARQAIDEGDRDALKAEADAELAAFRERMPAAAFERARETALDRLLRERLGVPVIALT